MHTNQPWTRRSARGITGLQTAIILIAFVVVASVFAFTVLSTGIFASERSKETVYAGLQEAKSTTRFAMASSVGSSLRNSSSAEIR